MTQQFLAFSHIRALAEKALRARLRDAVPARNIFPIELPRPKEGGNCFARTYALRAILAPAERVEKPKKMITGHGRADTSVTLYSRWFRDRRERETMKEKPTTPRLENAINDTLKLVDKSCHRHC